MTELRRYLAHFTPHWPALLAAAALMGIAAAVPGATVVLLQQTLDEVLRAGEPGALGLVAAGFAGLHLLAAVTGFLRTRITKAVAWDVTSALRRRLHAHWLALPPSQQAGTGERIASLTHEVDELQYGVSALVTAFRNPLTLLVLGGTAVVMAPRLAPLALPVLPVLLWTSRWGGRLLRRRAESFRRRRSDLVREMQDQLTGLRTIQDFGAEAPESARFAAVEERDRAARLRLEVERVLPSAAVQVVAAIAVAALVWAGGNEVIAGRLGTGQLVGFVVALGLMSRPLAGLSEVWSLLQRSLAALAHVHAALDRKSALTSPEHPQALPDGPFALRWEEVDADYGDGPVLHGVDLSVGAGERLVLVGPSGAGKSTLLALANRQLDPRAGRVTLGGVDLRELALPALRRAVAVVRQEGFLFARTVRENLALTGPVAEGRLWEALHAAGARAFVEGLPLGLDTPLDELGNRLSGGERQRLCLARALLTDAPVLLLDEATNQVDAETARDVLSALDLLRGERTVVLVAHDLSAARGADRIAVVEDGRVVEQGSHEGLMAARGRYASLWAARREVA